MSEWKPVKDNESLKRLLEKASKHVMTPAEIEAQRDSWVRAELELSRLDAQTTFTLPEPPK